MNWKYKHFETLNSTNDTAADHAPFTVITADAQTNGRGRYGRTWVSSRGNLYFSAVLPFEEASFAAMPFVAALAVTNALAPAPVKIKWPNDILLDGQKVAGVLLERVDNKLIIGVGINLAHAPVTDNPYPTGSLNGLFDRQTVIRRLADSLYYYWERACQNGFDPIRTEWLSKAIGLDKTISVRLANETTSGTFIDLSPTGALILQQPDHTQKHIVAGDIFLEKESK